MIGEITKAEVWMLGIDLPHPFPLAFGTLSTLPRVFLILTFTGHDQKQQRGIGEASIDFPFSHYDAWDVYHSLVSIDLRNRNVDDRIQILSNPEYRKLLEYPAAFAALNMAFDDAYGKLHGVSIPSLYGITRTSGQALESISMPSGITELQAAFHQVLQKGNVPKLKGGQGANTDAQFIQAALTVSNEAKAQFAVDFNASYTTEQFDELIQQLIKLEPSGKILFFEQPTTTDEGLEGLRDTSQNMSRSGLQVPVMADESFLTQKDAIFCQSHGIVLNYKIQKLGGILVASEIERSLTENLTSSMVGGTFPTAVGRVWDQQALCVLNTANLPSDGWQPSTDWFDGDRHLVAERFSKGKAFIGNGLGINVLWDRLSHYRIGDPKAEYRLIRNNQSGRRIQILLKKGVLYSNLYQQLTGKTHDWNL